MTTEGHIAALERRHRELDRQLETEMRYLTRNDMRIAELKRKKLEVKDELTRQQAANAA
jgi:hypothetical protein